MDVGKCKTRENMAIRGVVTKCFRNFVRNRRISLYKGSLEDWGKNGLRIGDRTQFHILPPKGRSVALQSAINCIRSSYARLLPTGRKKEHPTVSHQPYYDPSSGAKVIILFQLSKSIHTFFFWACSSLISYTAASFVALAWKVRIRLRPITQYLWCIAHIGYAHMSFLNSSGSGSIPWYSLGNSEDVR